MMLVKKILHNIVAQTNLTEQAGNVTAKAATVVSAAGAGTSLVAVNEFIQILAGVVAVIAGIAAAWWHFERIYDVHQERKRDNDRNRSGPKNDSR